MTLQCLRLDWLIAMGSVAPSGAAWAQTAVDHNHAACTALLQRYVAVLRNRQASQLHRAGFAAERAALEARCRRSVFLGYDGTLTRTAAGYR